MTAGTIMHGCHLPLKTWLLAAHIIATQLVDKMGLHDNRMAMRYSLPRQADIGKKIMLEAYRQSRFRLFKAARGWLNAAALALGASALGAGVAATQAHAQTGEFNVFNYATGAVENNNYFWRGYVFKPSRDATITGIYGGNGTNCEGRFRGAIFSVNSVIGSAATPTVSVGSILTSVQFAGTQNLTQEFVLLSEPLQVSADSYYPTFPKWRAV